MNFTCKIILLIFYFFVTSTPNVFGKTADQLAQEAQKIETILAESLVYYQSGLNQKAYKKSLEVFSWLGSKTSKKLQGKIFNHLGNLALESELYDEAIENYNKALDIYNLLDDQERVAAVYGNMAVVFEYLDKLDLSLEYNFRALDLHEINRDSASISNAYTNIGNTYADLGEYNLCRNYFIKALRLDSISTDKRKLSADYNNLGYLYSILKDNELAVKYYTTSLKIDIQLGSSMDQCITYFNIGNIYFNSEKINASLSNTKKSYSLAKQLNSVNYLMKNTNLLSKIYSKKHNYKEAYRYFEEFEKWSDSMDIKQNAALLYAKQLENSNQNNYIGFTNEMTEEKPALGNEFWSIFRVILYLSIATAIGYLIYKFIVLFTNR
ncbi:MAG: tetratricopeptide (TPR) repeat protein [Salibacteraceae bacterium]|jgi:tetratricopeptide (TPR) repeat protein